jgi:hypothetical protein
MKVEDGSGLGSGGSGDNTVGDDHQSMGDNGTRQCLIGSDTAIMQ